MDNKDSQRDENEVWLPTPQLQEEREEHLTTGTKISPELKSEPLYFQKNTFEKGLALPRVEVRLLKIEVNKRNHSDLRHKQEKRSLSTTTEHVTKRHRPEEAAQEETNALSHHSNLCTSQTVVDDCNYTCPLDTDEATDSENDDNRKDLQNPTTSDIHSDPESSCVGTQETFFTTTSSCLPTLTQLDQRGQCGGKEKAEVPRPRLYVPYKYDMEEEEMETESNMWKLRANRVQQILFSLDNEYCTFKRSKRFGIQYNVGFGPKQNFSIDSLITSFLIEISKFALAMNSSQEDFIMEILEYNFDFGHWSEGQRKSFSSKLMDRVRWLKNCEDAVKLSKEAFELHDFLPSLNMANQSMGSVKPEFSCMSRVTECDVAPTCSSDPQAETKEHKVDLYPFCKDIGLKLNVISSQENKKLDINKLTNGAMTEVTNFAEKLCGTFDQICLDILRHNFDLDWQREDADLAETILTRIPIIVEYRNLSSLRGFKKFKKTWIDFSILVMDYMECPNIDTCSAASSQAPTIDQNVGSSADNNHQNELNLWIWKLRSNQTKQILSVPHLEHCPLYSYSRCKKSGIDFNVGSGVKQNFDPSKYLTHGIMVEISTFAAALLSAQKEFITEILEYNFDLNFKNELCRSIFAQEIERSCGVHLKTNKPRFLKMRFELPDLRVINETTYLKASYCPKCYQDRNSELCQDESDLDHLRHPHPHCVTDTVPSASSCLAQKPEKDLSTAFQAAEETIMDSYPLCKKIGLSLCVDRDKPKVKLDTSTLTRAVMKEIVHFAKRLCGRINKITNDVLEHNFNFGILQSQNFNPSELFNQVVGRQYNKGLTWFNDICVIQSNPTRSRRDKWKKVSAMQKNERKETTKERKLALLTKKEEAALLPDFSGAAKRRTHKLASAEIFPLCAKIGLDLDVTSKSEKKEKLDLKLLTIAVVVEIHKYLTRQPKHYYPGSLYDILDYNFDVSSQNYRRWEFSIAAASEVKFLIKHYRYNVHRANEVFKLPFVFKQKASNGSRQERLNQKTGKSHQKYHAVQQLIHHSAVSHAHFLDVNMDKEQWVNKGTASPKHAGTMMQMTRSPGRSVCDSPLQEDLQIKEDAKVLVQTKTEVWFHEEDIKSETYPETMKQQTGSPMSAVCDGPLQENIQIKEDENDSYHVAVEPEPVSEKISKLMGSLGYNLLTICPLSESNIKTEPETDETQYYSLTRPQVSEGCGILAVCPNSESNVKTEPDTEDVKYEIPLESVGSQAFCSITTHQDTDSTLVKTEQENVPVMSNHYDVVCVKKQN